MKRLRSLFLLLPIAALAVTFASYRPHAEEVPPEDPTPVSEAELETYLKVYKAMQADHGLTIDDALAPTGMSLSEFRGVERRLQTSPRLVERAREALLEHAKTNSAFALALGTPTPASTPPSKGDKKP
jgi:hypothetical protein